MKTELTQILGIEYPIIQGGMAWVAEYHLAAAVSEAGGLGLIGAASAPADWVREQVREAKKLTDKPFGVNIMLMSPYADEVAKVIVEEGVKVVTTGAGNPEKYMPMWKEAGVKVVPVVASVAHAKRMERCGADAVVAEDVVIGVGTVVMAGAVINPGTHIGKGCIINTCSSVDHDCIVDDFVHVAVGSHLCGTVNVGAGTWIGAGVTVSNNVFICPDCMIGAGAVIVNDIWESGTYVGVPAKRVM